MMIMMMIIKLLLMEDNRVKSRSDEGMGIAETRLNVSSWKKRVVSISSQTKLISSFEVERPALHPSVILNDKSIDVVASLEQV